MTDDDHSDVRPGLGVPNELSLRGYPEDEALIKQGKAMEEVLFRALAQRGVWGLKPGNKQTAEKRAGIAVDEHTPAEKLAALK